MKEIERINNLLSILDDFGIQNLLPPVKMRELAKAISQFVIKARERLVEYCVHDKDCICSQWRQGRPTESGGYETLFGYGKDEKWYQRGEEPHCTCGLSTELKKGIE